MPGTLSTSDYLPSIISSAFSTEGNIKLQFRRPTERYLVSAPQINSIMAQPNASEKIAKDIGRPEYANKKPEELPWYLAEVETLEPDAKELFEKYCQIPSDQVKSRIKEAVSQLSTIFLRIANFQQRDIAFKIVCTSTCIVLINH